MLTRIMAIEASVAIDAILDRGRTAGFIERRQGNVPLKATVIAASLQSLVRPFYVAVSLCGRSLYNEDETVIHREI